MASALSQAVLWSKTQNILHSHLPTLLPNLGSLFLSTLSLETKYELPIFALALLISLQLLEVDTQIVEGQVATQVTRIPMDFFL